LNAINLGLDDLDVSTEESATAAIDIVGDAINQLSAVRAKIGAYANRIEHTITNLDTTEENMTASYSRIMDVDMAEETTEYTSLQVLVQAATSVLAQANERPQEVLQLLQ
jgi:flagellin